MNTKNFTIPKNILVVDDMEEDFVILSEVILRAFDQEVNMVHCPNVEDLPDLLEKSDYELIFLDYIFGTQTSLEVIETIRKKEPFVAVFILTSQADERIGIQFVRAGADDYILKSDLTPKLLSMSIQSGLDRSRHRREQFLKEQAIKELNEKLEEKVRERTHQLEFTNEQLENTLSLLKNTQNELIQSEKMAALGQLVAGIAHEINTPLGVAVMAASFLKDKTNDFQKRHQESEVLTSVSDYAKDALEASQLILKNLARSASLVQSFKKVAVDQTSDEQRLFNLYEYLEDTLTSLNPEIKRKNISTKLIGDKDFKLYSYPGVFSQIVTNLIMNSIFHGFKYKNSGHVTVSFSKKDGKLVFIYEDNGRGIPNDILPKIFEPFFSTDKSGKGSGLGLHILYNLITQKLKGSITCCSSVGSGCVFRIKVPYHINK